MNFLNDFPNGGLLSFIGKNVRIDFADKTPPMVGEVVRFTSAPDNDGEYASIEISSAKFPNSYVSIFENEIDQISTIDAH